jgi:PAS domain S-box-containing protein
MSSGTMTQQKILVVDDSITYLQAFKRDLQASGYGVELASSGTECLQKVRLNKPDCIIMDMNMPDLNGDEACRILKNDPELRSIPILMMTVHESSTFLVQCLNAGADDFVGKSEDLEVALARMKVLLRMQSMQKKEGENQKKMQLLSTLVDRSRFEAIVVFNHDKKIIHCNLAAEKMFGTSKEVLYELEIDRLFVDLEKDFFCRGSFLSKNEQGTLEASALKSGEVTFPVDISVNFVEKDNVDEGIVFIRDITDRKSITNELEAKNAEMEQFVYTVSHDLKSPLITISNFVELSEQSLDSGELDDARSCLNKIGKAAINMADLLSNLLHLSSIGRVTHAHQDIDTHALIHSCLEHHMLEIKKRKVRLIMQDSFPTISGDKTRLSEVFDNFISNAIKYLGEQPEPCLEIGTEHHTEENIFYVRDNGMGIEARHRELVYGLFQRVSVKLEGTGVGLAIVKRIIEHHGGKSWVESEGLGKGSTFKFSLPLVANISGSRIEK